MRPVNLIPPEERRGDRAPTRTGPVSYLIVGALALALGAVTLVVLAGNQIADREDELAELEAEAAAAQERTAALAPYAEFASLEDTRASTVESLARSRFDWERVLRELALVIPAEVELAGVGGSVAPGVSAEGATGSPLREQAPGPALEITGCAATTRVVAELVAALEDIDGVTRVGVNRSTRAAQEGTSGATGASAAVCASEKPVFNFEMVAAFDAVAVPAATADAATGESEPASDPGVAGARRQRQAAGDALERQAGEARRTASLIPGVAR